MSRRRALEDDLGFLLAWASALIVKASNQAMAPHGLKVRAYSVLSVVCGEPGGSTQRQVGDDVGLDPSQVVALVELESRGLVARIADPNDRRNKWSSPRSAGAAYVSRRKNALRIRRPVCGERQAPGCGADAQDAEPDGLFGSDEVAS